MTALTPFPLGGPDTSKAPRPRCLVRVRFEGLRSPDQFEHLLVLIEDFTPIWQPSPPDTVDLDLTSALSYFGDTAHHIAQMIQIRALALHGVHTAVGGGPSVMLAQMAATITTPGRVTLVDPTEAAVAAFLRPRPVP
ncbi:hypothetical protein JQK87_37720, partial [Streptomyces sp. G44]|nr:hypothetical protein [Streptomyces sp. G44]